MCFTFCPFKFFSVPIILFLFDYGLFVKSNKKNYKDKNKNKK